MIKKITFIDLFAGLGGIRLGFQNAFKKLGYTSECVFSSEIKDYAIKAYQGYYGKEKVSGDITKILSSDIPNFDFLLAGFPCQPFSTAGKGLGFNDTRGTLFFEIERILQDKIDKGCPAKGFLLENVEGLLNHDNGRTLTVMINHLNNLGYKTTYQMLDSQYFGVAQSRKRVYIVGTLDNFIELNNFPVKISVLKDILDTNLPTIKSEFTKQLFSHYSPSDIIGKSIKDKRGGDNNIHSWDIELKGKTSLKERKLLNAMLKERRKKKWAEEIGIKWMDGMPLTEKQIKTFFNDKDLNHMLKDLVEKGYLKYEHPKKFIDNHRVYDTSKERGYNIVAGKLSFEFSKILNPNEIAPTLVATDVSKMGVIDGNGLRRLTIREAQRLCGYPENYDLSIVRETEAFDLLGNTVCIPVIEAISSRIGLSIKGNCDENNIKTVI